MRKWHDRTQGKLQWPVEGTFDEEACTEVREMLRHWKPRKDDDKSRGKKYIWLEILEWFVREGRIIKEKEEAVKQAIRKQEEQSREEKEGEGRPPPYQSDQGACGRETGLYPSLTHYYNHDWSGWEEVEISVENSIKEK